MSKKVKGSDLLVAALENEGVDRIFGVPGEENLDVDFGFKVGLAEFEKSKRYGK
jgi:hypothetical protein